jgi:hypothetical protein
MSTETAGLPYITQLSITEFPLNSVGHRFAFSIKAFTDYDMAINGVESDLSETMILAGLPDQPSAAPSRNIETSQTTVAVNIVTVPGDHGSPIQTYIIECDDGFGGAFKAVQGE